MRCLSCDYDLSNLTEHRCPECGRAFDPRNPKTFSTITPAEKKEMLLGFLIWLAVMAGVCVLLQWRLSCRKRPVEGTG